ncbi:MAG: hypothetical protein ACP5EK_03160 [Thermoplasmatota archaeon]
MDRRDRIVVFAGIVILVIALAGVLLQGEESTEAEKTVEMRTFNVNWNEKTGSYREEGYVAKGGTETFNFSINKEGLTGVTFTLEWSDDWSRGFIIPWNWSDTLELSVSAPSGVQFSGSSTVSGTGSPLEVEAAMGTTPNSMQVNASNMTAVQEMVKEKYMSSTGSGVWQASVGISTKPFLLDRGNDFTIHVSYSYFEPAISEVTS